MSRTSSLCKLRSYKEQNSGSHPAWWLFETWAILTHLWFVPAGCWPYFMSPRAGRYLIAKKRAESEKRGTPAVILRWLVSAESPTGLVHLATNSCSIQEVRNQADSERRIICEVWTGTLDHGAVTAVCQWRSVHEKLDRLRLSTFLKECSLPLKIAVAEK